MLPSNYRPVDAQQASGSSGSKESRFTVIPVGQEGVRVRVLTPFIAGWKLWAENPQKPGKRKPFYKHEGESFPTSMIGVNSYGQPETPKRFVAAQVWNYATNQLEVLETEKKAIIRKIEEFEKDEDWGDVREYDIVLKKVKTGPEAKDVEYSAIQKPKKALDAGIQKQFAETPCDLDALFDGGYPFDTKVVKPAYQPMTSTLPKQEDDFSDIPF